MILFFLAHDTYLIVCFFVLQTSCATAGSPCSRLSRKSESKFLIELDRIWACFITFSFTLLVRQIMHKSTSDSVFLFFLGFFLFVFGFEREGFIHILGKIHTQILISGFLWKYALKAGFSLPFHEKRNIYLTTSSVFSRNDNIKRHQRAVSVDFAI